MSVKKKSVFYTNKENKLVSSLWKRDKSVCFLCETFFENSIKVHHIMPVAEGGSNKKSNMTLVHSSCYHEYFIQFLDNREKLTKIDKNLNN